MTKTFYEVTFLSEVNVEKILEAIKEKFPSAEIVKKTGTMNRYMVIVPDIPSDKNAPAGG